MSDVSNSDNKNDKSPDVKEVTNTATVAATATEESKRVEEQPSINSNEAATEKKSGTNVHHKRYSNSHIKTDV